jgi:hypothetical protein
VPTPKPACIDALREAADRLGESPTKAQYEALGLTPASGTIIRQLGGWNEAKRAAELETYRSTGSKAGAKPDDVELPAGTQWTELSVDQRWHYRNRERNAERTRKRRARLRAWVSEQKRARGCRNCGSDDPAELDFHHRDSDEKEMAIGEMVTYGYGTDALREEMAKCDVLCANCHRKTHHEPTKRPGRRWVYERKRTSNGCSRCAESDPRCLDFHHVRGRKRATVARLLADGRPKEVIEAELAKCELLCANCHRQHHYEPPDPADGSPEHDNHK